MSRDAEMRLYHRIEALIFENVRMRTFLDLILSVDPESEAYIEHVRNYAREGLGADETERAS